MRTYQYFCAHCGEEWSYISDNWELKECDCPLCGVQHIEPRELSNERTNRSQ